MSVPDCSKSFGKLGGANTIKVFPLNSDNAGKLPRKRPRKQIKKHNILHTSFITNLKIAYFIRHAIGSWT
jgi:hypothetical protein